MQRSLGKATSKPRIQCFHAKGDQPGIDTAGLHTRSQPGPHQRLGGLTVHDLFYHALYGQGQHLDSLGGALKRLYNRHIGDAAAFAHGLQSETLAASAQRMDQGSHQLGAAGAQRMAERDGAAVDV
jgi:hypothetical protein